MLETLRPALPAIAGLLAFFGVLMTLIGAGSASRKDPLRARLENVTQSARSIEELEMQAPFAERFLKPLASASARFMAKLTPNGVLDETQRRLTHAGFTGRMQSSDFVGLKGLGILLGAGLGVLLTLGLGVTGFLAGLIVLAFTAVGYVLPDFWLRQRINRRRLDILNALPDTIDLLTISVEAGLGFDQALARIVSKSDNTLSREFARVLQEMRVGVSRREALRALVARTGVDDLSTFVTAIIQAEQLGASVGKVLRIQSTEMRVRRRQRAETLAHQAPIKILFPMAFLIFPPIFIVVLGPAIPRIVGALAPGLKL